MEQNNNSDNGSEQEPKYPVYKPRDLNPKTKKATGKLKDLMETPSEELQAKQPDNDEPEVKLTEAEQKHKTTLIKLYKKERDKLKEAYQWSAEFVGGEPLIDAKTINEAAMDAARSKLVHIINNQGT